MRSGALLPWILTPILIGAQGPARSSDAPDATTFSISGRIVDSSGGSVRGLIVSATTPTGDNESAGDGIPVRDDGSFRFERKHPGTYRLTAGADDIRTPSGAGGWTTKADRHIGSTLVTIVRSNIDDVVIVMKPGVRVRGALRLEPPDSGVDRPSVHVFASPALDGLNNLDGPGAAVDGDRTFELHNVQGPVVIRTGYSYPPDSRGWWFDGVYLDGQDVTNVPIDFVHHPNARLEVVFTQSPSCVEGTVVDRRGAPVSSARIVIFSKEERLWQPWSTTTVQTASNSSGWFSAISSPGSYLAVALPEDHRRLHDWSRTAFESLAALGEPFVIAGGGCAALELTLTDDRRQ